KVGEVVDINGITAPDPASVWYRVKCSGGTGWVDQTRLFGPLVLPGEGGVGLVKPDAGNIPLLAEAGGTASVGDCPADTLVTTQAIQQLGEQVFYQIKCGDLTGWTLQD